MARRSAQAEYPADTGAQYHDAHTEAITSELVDIKEENIRWGTNDDRQRVMDFIADRTGFDRLEPEVRDAIGTLDGRSMTNGQLREILPALEHSIDNAVEWADQGGVSEVSQFTARSALHEEAVNQMLEHSPSWPPPRMDIRPGLDESVDAAASHVINRWLHDHRIPLERTLERVEQLEYDINNYRETGQPPGWFDPRLMDPAVGEDPRGLTYLMNQKPDLSDREVLEADLKLRMERFMRDYGTERQWHRGEFEIAVHADTLARAATDSLNDHDLLHHNPGQTETWRGDNFRNWMVANTGDTGEHASLSYARTVNRTRANYHNSQKWTHGDVSALADHIHAVNEARTAMAERLHEAEEPVEQARSQAPDYPAIADWRLNSEEAYIQIRQPLETEEGKQGLLEAVKELEQHFQDHYTQHYGLPGDTSREIIARWLDLHGTETADTDTSRALAGEAASDLQSSVIALEVAYQVYGDDMDDGVKENLAGSVSALLSHAQYCMTLLSPERGQDQYD